MSPKDPKDMKRVARQMPTPVTPTSGLRTSGLLPDDVVQEQIRRLALFSAVGAGLWTFGVSMDTVFVPLANFSTIPHRANLLIDVIGVLVSLVMFVYVRWGSHSAAVKGQAALVFMVINAALVAGFNVLTLPNITGPTYQLSWVAGVILISSMFSLARPLPLLIASLAAASMDPLGVWIAHLIGLKVPPAAQTLVLFLPNYACAVVAMVPGHFLHRLGHRLREAQELGSYQLVELLGRGGMGEVWHARHELLARNAAIKLIRPALLGAASESEARLLLGRFKREAQATAALSSPHTIQIFDYGTTSDGTFYYVMEFLTGRDLESLVREFGPMTADRAMFLLRQICHSLADAHARGLVHRDIKPANIYVCRMGLDYDFVKVLDFGLVKMSGSSDTKGSFLTLDHVTTGTPSYMAPEVILGEADVDRRADVYALGCVAYYLLTGQLVFEGDTPMKVMLQHVHEPPIPPSERTELRIPRELDALVMACLEKDPARRPQSAEQLLGAAHSCKTCEGWTQVMAHSWWDRHLPELTGPLTETGDTVGQHVH
jgi:eukaryotic-like serine/threonine-protein kinase